MKLSEKKSSNFQPCPEFTGRAVCVDVTPPEVKQTDFGPKEKFRIVFEIDLLDEENKRPFCVWSSGFTTSLNEKASLRKFLRTWFGRDLTAQELEEFDTESLLGKPAFVVITHSAGDNGETYSNITACTPHKVGEALAPSGKFTRKKDRPAKDAAAGSGASYRKAEQPKTEQGEAPVGRENWMTTKVHIGKHAGVDLGDLDADAVTKLITNWVPVHAKNAKPLAADKRLAEALGFAKAALEEASAPAKTAAPAAPEY